VIHVATARTRLLPLEQFGLDALVDHSSLLPVQSASDQVVSLRVTEDPAGALGDPLSLQGASGVVSIPRASLAQIGAVAGAVAEQESEEADRHGRVPSSVNSMVVAGLSQSPWVSASARALRDAVIRNAGTRPVRTIAPWPGGHRWAAAFTHDLDVVSHWPLFAGLRVIELGKKGKLGQAMAVSGSAARSLLGNPVEAGVREILAIERDHGISSTWFVIAGIPTLKSTTQGDVTYSVDSSRARRILAAVREGDHEIGMHGSFATFVDSSVMGQERERLARVTGSTVTGIRQHFLRMRPGVTQRAMREAGFSYDSTFGFPDRNGFRLGTAHPVPAWDHAAKQAIALEEAPLTWMDRALSKYRGIEVPALWVDEGLALARAARDEEGLWVGLWHPNLTRPLGFPGAVEEFRRLVVTIQSLQPFIAPLGVITQWRRARRSLVARDLSPQGVPSLGSGIAGSWPVVLEDGRGNPVERLSWPAAA
jgi:peptidoglycan/xylan/chitin deacetylase (PgdA/CDA1 family)